MCKKNDFQCWLHKEIHFKICDEFFLTFKNTHVPCASYLQPSAIFTLTHWPENADRSGACRREIDVRVYQRRVIACTLQN
jgi:hypothetical protein